MKNTSYNRYIFEKYSYIFLQEYVQENDLSHFQISANPRKYIYYSREGYFQLNHFEHLTVCFFDCFKSEVDLVQYMIEIYSEMKKELVIDNIVHYTRKLEKIGIIHTRDNRSKETHF